MKSEITYYPGPMPLTGEIINKYGARKIEQFRVEGVSDQKRHVVTAITDIKTGDYLASINPDLIRKNLRETGILSRVEINYRPTMQGVILILKLEEKSRTVALPYFTLSESDVYSGGAFFSEKPIDLVSGSSGSKVWQAGGLNGFIRYKNPELQGTQQDMEIFFCGSYEDRIHADTGGIPLRSFKGYSGRLDMKWAFRTDSKLRPTFLLFYDMFDVDHTWNENINAPQTAELIGTGIELEYQNYYFLNYFNEGSEADLVLSRTQLIVENSDAYTVHFRFDHNTGLFSDHRLQFSLRAGRNPVPPALLGFLQGSGHYLLPPKKSNDRLYASCGTVYEIPVQYSPWGTLTSFAFLEGGIYSPTPEDTQVYFGPGIGQHLFLKGLPLPVISVTLGYNIVRAYFSTTFFAGIRF